MSRKGKSYDLERLVIGIIGDGSSGTLLPNYPWARSEANVKMRDMKEMRDVGSEARSGIS